ncbi:hypothetical protein [Snodgrassella gandavensis]|nr:hypothetical protein [Snodgrassella gandavensis]
MARSQTAAGVPAPLWQANLNEGQTLKNASYHYLISDHLGNP